jgi:uncharacterized membrane protein (DUF106 family)
LTKAIILPFITALIKAYTTSKQIKKDKEEAKKKLNELKKAKEENDEESYNNIIDNL